MIANVSFINTPTPPALSQQSAAMGSSKQLPGTLKMSIIGAHKAGGGYIKIAKYFQEAEVNLRSGRPRKLSKRTARRIARKANQNPRLTAKVRRPQRNI